MSIPININNYLCTRNKKRLMNLYFFEEREHFPQHSVVSIGMFDGVHRGHQMIIKELIEMANKHNTSPLLIAFSRHPRFVLHNEESRLQLLTTSEERYRLLEQFGIHNCVEIAFDEKIASRSATDFVNYYLIEKLAISGLILGYDNSFGNKKTNDFDQIFSLAERNNFFIRKADALYCNGIAISSTQIRKAIADNDIELANAMLGYAYSFSGKVVDGNKTGRQIGFPTANISEINKEKMIPHKGVYIVDVLVSGERYRGMMNIGLRPTFGGTNQTVEVHLINFSGNLYGQNITVEVLKKLREEHSFDSVEDLKRQLEIDRQRSINH